MRDQLVTETIDPRILRLVGLEDVFDLDYDTYLTLLKEAQVKGKNTLPAEEQAELANERKRVRGKTGRFKPKIKTINVDNITSVKTMGQRLLPAAKGKGGQTKQNQFIKSLEAIRKVVESLSTNVLDQNKQDKKEAEEDRKKEENKKRKEKEESLESKAKKLLTSAKKLFAPTKSIFDSIFNYLYYTFLGKGVTEAFNWLADPKNKDKVQAISKFVKDFWPALLGAATLFFTPLGGFIKNILGILKGVAGNPYFMGALLFSAPKILESTNPELTDKQERETAAAPGTKEEKIKKLEAERDKISPFFDIQGKRSEIEEQIEFLKTGKRKSYGWAKGGLIDQNSGIKISGAGADTQLTALSPGEIVMNRSAVKALGAHNLLALNSTYGGPNANRPKFAGNIQFAQNGGLVGGFMDWWNRGRNMRVPSENTARFGGLKQYFKKIPDPTTLFGDDALQITRSNKAFQSGATGYRGWNPFKAFTPEMVRTGPTPAIRQAIERPLRAAAPILKRAAPIAEGIGGIQLGMELHNFMQQRNTTIRAQQYGYGTVEDMMVAPERYQKPVQLGRSTPRTPSILPVSKPKSSLVTLPPVVQSSSSATPKAGGSEIPQFSAIAPGNRRMENAQIYGLVP